MSHGRRDEQLPTDAGDISNVLRYWLAMVQHEEALGQTLRVAMRRPPKQPDLVDPVPGQAYIKLLTDEVIGVPDEERRAAVEAFTLREGGDLSFEVTGERTAFFEHWLRQTYERERSARFGGGEEGDGTYVVGFPTLHHRRKGVLATLLRFPVAAPAWATAAGGAWEAPTYRERRQGKVPAPPARVRIREIPDESDEGFDDEPLLPFALDAHQASRTLGIPEEHVGRFVSELAEVEGVSAGGMVAALTALLSAPDSEYPEDAVAQALSSEEGPAKLLERLALAVRARSLPPGVSIWPGALAWDASRAAATLGLQRDLRELIARPTPPREDGALGAYLRGESTPPATGLHLGLRGHALTDDQREVADRTLAQRLVCAQGPPGTGKTELILNLAAHVFIEQMAGAVAGDPPSLPAGALMVVASTNNRAVDNVMDPLCGELPPERLPLALRLGSRAIMKEVAAQTMARAEAWLERGDPTAAAKRWPVLLEKLVALRAKALRALEPLRLSRESALELGPAQARLAELRRLIDVFHERFGAMSPKTARAAGELLEGTRAWREALELSVTKLERAARVSPSRAARLFKRAREAHAQTVAPAAASLGMVLRLPALPEAEAPGDAWMGVFAALEETLEELEASASAMVPGGAEGVVGAWDVEGLEEEREALEARVAALKGAAPQGQAPADPRGAASEDQLGERELFRLACEAREVWALLHRDRLRPLLKDLRSELARKGTLRGRVDNDPAAARELFELFPVVGCTLLSLGNAFPLEGTPIGQVIIDEAGQCHPAYAVSALARAHRALVIGDPHQIEPVIGLDDSEEQRVLRRIASPLTAAQLSPFRAVREAGTSAQTLAARAMGGVLPLTDHFRCQAPIIRISDALCGYGLRVRTAAASMSDHSVHLPGPLVLHDVRGEQIPRAGSWANEAEVERVSDLVSALVADGVAPGRLAVLTPYRGQLEALRASFKRAGLPVEDPLAPRELSLQSSLFDEGSPGDLALGTVHRFQGGERDVVIFSTVITRERSLTFLNRRVNLVNVAVSRARMHLLVVGHPGLLEQGPVTAALLRAIPLDRRLSGREPLATRL